MLFMVLLAQLLDNSVFRQMVVGVLEVLAEFVFRQSLSLNENILRLWAWPKG